MDIQYFRQIFPAFADSGAYPDAYLLLIYDMATQYISDVASCSLPATTLALALNFMTAHLVATANATTQNTPVGALTAATIDKVSITLQSRTNANDWSLWLASSPYGIQLAALLRVHAAGGFEVGSRPERAAFRGVGGVFW